MFKCHILGFSGKKTMTEIKIIESEFLHGKVSVNRQIHTWDGACAQLYLLSSQITC